MTDYNSKSAEFAADVAELVAAYKAEGFKAADITCVAIRNQRRLTDSEALSLADAFRRSIILGG